MSADLLWAGDGLVPDAAYTAGERRSECTRCPKWVVRCMHFDGQTIRLDQRDGQWHRCPMAGFGNVGKSPDVTHAVFGPAAPQPCMRGCGALLFSVGDKSTIHTDEAAARAEFERRCAILMGRDTDDPRDDPPPTLQDEARWRADDDRWALERQEARRRGER